MKYICKECKEKVGQVYSSPAKPQELCLFCHYKDEPEMLLDDTFNQLYRCTKKTK